MALYAFDGTWNTAKTTEDPQYRHTNVYRFYEAYRKQSVTDDLYVPGVGTRLKSLGRVLGGVFGLGELKRIHDAYDHVCKQWEKNDKVINVVGFSRGAATTLDFCHCVQSRGIRKPGTETVVEPQPQINFLGVWDVVAAFGLANLGNTALNIGHHLSLPKSSLKYCFHAMALDERRPSFLPTRLPGAVEVWFRGVHSDVGGGNTNRGLNDITLKWMLSKAKAAGLKIDDADIASLRPDPVCPPNAAHKLPLAVRLISAVDRSHYSVSPLAGFTNPPKTCLRETEADEQRATEIGAGGLELMPPEARERIAALWDTAEAAAKAQGFGLDQVQDAMLTLFQGRITLVTNDNELKTARAAVTRLVTTMIQRAHERGFYVVAEYFMNEALFDLPRLFPLTD